MTKRTLKQIVRDVENVKQPKIRVSGKEHKVMQVTFNSGGLIEKIVYQIDKNSTDQYIEGIQ